MIIKILCFVDCASRCNRVKTTNFMHNLFLVYFVTLYTFPPCGPYGLYRASVLVQGCALPHFTFLNVSGLSRPIIKKYNQSYQNNRQSSKRISTNCCIHTVVPPDDGPRYSRNMYRLTKYTKNKLCIKLAFRYIIISRCTVNKT